MITPMQQHQAAGYPVGRTAWQDMSWSRTYSVRRKMYSGSVRSVREACINTLITPSLPSIPRSPFSYTASGDSELK